MNLSPSESMSQADGVFEPILIPETRLASSYKHLQKFNTVWDEWPVGASSFQPCLHDIQHIQAILANSENFSASSQCDIFELSRVGGAWLRGLDDAALLDYVKVISTEPPLDSH